MNTALILRPKDAPKIHVLEVDGPKIAFDPIINYSPRTNLPLMDFEEWMALPEHDKNPRYENPSNQDFHSACRVARLIDDQLFPCRQKLEILARLELLFPGCTDNRLPTQPNLA